MKERIYRLRIDAIDWISELFMRALDILSARRKKAWRRWNAVRTDRETALVNANKNKCNY